MREYFTNHTGVTHQSESETIMAKGQQKGNRETKKPKKEKIKISTVDPTKSPIESIINKGKKS